MTPLEELLAEHDRLRKVWESQRGTLVWDKGNTSASWQHRADYDPERAEADRVAMQSAWHPSHFSPDREQGIGGRCRPAALMADNRIGWGKDQTGELLYRGCCWGCGWVAVGARDCENLAVEDAHDHAWPGWRDLPIVDRWGGRMESNDKNKRKITEAWMAKWADKFPLGWLEEGGPILTLREKHGTRHVEGYAPGGGYDLCANELRPNETAAGQLALFG